MEWLVDIFEGVGNVVSGWSFGGANDIVLLKSSANELNSEKGDFLGVNFYDDDFLKLLIRFCLSVFFVGFIVRVLYYPIAKRKDFLFTYVMISIITFFICFALKKFDLESGVALALFAIFGIIRYRTDPIPIKEMTYLFIVIGVSVINALANKKMSYAELLFANFAVVGVTYGLEKVWLLKHEAYKTVIYEKINLIKPEHYQEMKDDLELRTGLKINRVEVGKVDFLRDVANLKIYYFEEEQTSPQFEDSED